jgi:dTDP-4-dehydrorhamnose reductase
MNYNGPIMKVAVIGSTGLLGSSVCQEVLARGHKLLAYSNHPWVEPKARYEVRPLSLCNFDLVMRELFDQWPDAIVNCAAVSSPDQVDQNPQLAHLINVEAARKLAEISSHLGARHMHISTDMVFDGSSSPYRSTDPTNPLSEYGRQKLEAEKQVLRVTDQNLVVLRITLLNGNSPRGNRSPHERILNAMANGQKSTLFTDEYRQTSSAENVAQLLIELIERPNLNGLFHWCGSEVVTRYELGRKILQRFGFDDQYLEASTLADFHEKVGERPARLTFELAPLVSKVKTKPATLEEQLDEMHLPSSLYSWYRKNVDHPGIYHPRF